MKEEVGMKKLLLIYNPVSGMTKTRLSLQKAVEYYDSRDYLVTVCLVNRLEDYAKDIDFKSYDLIVCSGGDGTLNITVSFLIRKNLPAQIAYIPSGSTNDFAYSLGLSGDADALLQNTIEGQPRRIDVGRFNASRYFLYVAAFGIFTKVSYTTSQKAKNLLGHAAYILEGIKSIADLKSYHIKAELDEEIIEDDFILGMVTNSLSIGGFRNILPSDTALDDGLFEVVLVKMPKNLTALNEIVLSLVGEKPEDNQHIFYGKTSRVIMRSEEKISWALDGEFGGEEDTVRIENRRKLLSIIC